MTHEQPSAAAPRGALTTQPSAVLDAHGFDPTAYDWVPVRRVPRHDGWSEEKQRRFIGTLADTGSVTHAAREVGMSAKSAYALRRAVDGVGFARAWDAAIRQAMDRLIDVCLDRALEGSEEPIYHEGRCVGHRIRHHDRMAMFLLRAHRPDLFRDAHRADRARGEPLPAAPEPVAEAMAAIDPVPPAEPHRLACPDQLDTDLMVADVLEGELPRWHRDPDLAQRDAAVPPDAEGPVLGDAFERQLAAAKAGTWQPRKGKRARRRKPL
jgi:hypothetical protein